MPAVRPVAPDGTVWAFLKSRPILLLLLLTPGIPEYLSGSSPINAVVLNPGQFVFQIVANLGLYGPGALLIHEAKVRWGKGWASVLLLGGAYGILEEGVALSTLFNPAGGPVGTLGTYGHWLGVNWVWSAGIVPFHAVWSISLPILILGLAVPQSVNRRLLSDRGTAATAGILGLDVVLLMIFVHGVSGYWMGLPILSGSLAAVALLILLARRAPAGLLAARTGARNASNRSLLLVGVSFFPVVLLSQGLGEAVRIPAAVDFGLVTTVQALYLAYLTRGGARPSPRGKIVLVLGLVLPIMVLGTIAEIALPLNLLVDLGLVLLLRELWRMYPAAEPAGDPLETHSETSPSTV